MSNMNYEKLRDDLVSWLRERAQEAHAKVGLLFNFINCLDKNMLKYLK